MAKAARDRSRMALALVAGLVSVFALLGVANKAEDGRQAILKWKPAFALLDAGESPYARAVPGAAAGEEQEGYPTLPLSAVLMDALLVFGDVGGSLAFAVLKLGCVAWILIGSARLARLAGWRFPAWAEWALFLLSLRVLLSDLTHGNTNLLVGACVVAAAWNWARGRDSWSGGWVAVGAVLKVTPVLLLGVLARRPSVRGWLGVAAGVLLALLAVPGLRYGFAANLGYLGAFADQMLAPYLEGRPPGPMQTEHINQSLLGMTARLFSDQVAIQPRGDTWPEAVRLTWIALSAERFRQLHLAVSLLALVPFGWVLWKRPERRFAGALFGLGALEMLLLSERSWKHHHVAVPLALAWTLGMLASARSARERAIAGLALGAVTFGHALSGSGILGDRGSDLAEAWGAFLLADLALVACLTWSCLAAPPPEPDAPCSTERA
ncbi:MAG: glycosyltransferase family 87 protein [Planctomycetota bacterium]